MIFMKNLINLISWWGHIPRKYILVIRYMAAKHKMKSQKDITDKVTELVNSIGDNHKEYGLLRTMIQNGHLDSLFIQ